MSNILSAIKNNPEKILFGLTKIGVANVLSDKVYLRMLYRLAMGKKLDLDNPKTFNEKLQWLKLNDRKDIYTTMVDKYEAKKYVAELIGEDHIVPTLGVWDSFDDIDFEKLPNQFVLKCTHDSGGLVICKDKKTLDVKKAKKKINKSLKTKFFYRGREWPYKNVKPRIIAEEYIEDLSGGLIDYKFFSYNGNVKHLFVCSDRNGHDLCMDFFDLNWNHLDLERRSHPNSTKELKKPELFDEMVELATILSKDTYFSRIDFYEVNEKVYFGEITFFPGSGVDRFTDDKWDEKLGKLIDLDRVKSQKQGFFNKIKNNPEKILFGLTRIGVANVLSDKVYLRMIYRLAMGKKLDLDNPKTFNEKLQWLKLNDRKDIYTTMVDKYEAKKYVAELIGEDHIVPTLGVWDSFDDIDFEKLPNQFVLKCTHDSGGLVICKDKKTLDVKKAKKKINKSLKTKFFYRGREWPYKNVTPRIIAEKYLEDESGGLIDYKFFCYKGKVKNLFVATERNANTETKFDFFDREFNHLPFTNGHPNAKMIPEKPKKFGEMIELSELLSKSIPFVRMDFYEVEDKVYFGEMTFSHWSGLVPFDPPEWDEKMGD